MATMDTCSHARTWRERNLPYPLLEYCNDCPAIRYLTSAAEDWSSWMDFRDFAKQQRNQMSVHVPLSVLDCTAYILAEDDTVKQVSFKDGSWTCTCGENCEHIQLLRRAVHYAENEKAGTRRI